MKSSNSLREIDDFIRRLNTRDFRNIVRPEYKIGKPLYDHLLEAVRSGRLSHHQTANALAVLSKLRFHGSELEVFDVIVTSLQHAHQRVRDEAAKRTIGFLRKNRWLPPFYSNSVAESLRTVAATTLDEHARRLVTTFIEHGPAGWSNSKRRKVDVPARDSSADADVASTDRPPTETIPSIAPDRCERPIEGPRRERQ